MFLEAIENVTKFESDCKERKAASEVQARQMIQDAEKNGLAVLQKIRSDAAEEGKLMLQKAEADAAEKSAAIRSQVDESIAVMTATAAGKLDEAAEFIVGRIVNY